jgi:hypothetical protein
MFTLLRNDADGGDVPQRKKKLRPSEPVMELDKLRITVLSFKNIQFTNDDIGSDDDDDSMDENDHNKAKYRRIISAHVGIRPVPSRRGRETIRVITPPAPANHNSPMFPPSEGYVLSLGAVEKKLVYFKDKQDGTDEVGVAFHWGDFPNWKRSDRIPPSGWNRQRYHHSEYRDCPTTPHLEIQRQIPDNDCYYNHETVIDIQVCVKVHQKNTFDVQSSYACCHGFGQLKISAAELMLMEDSPEGLVAAITITKRKAPSFFPKKKKCKSSSDDWLRFSRGSSLLVRIEREESFEREQLKQQVWKECNIGREHEKNHQQKSGDGSCLTDSSLSSNAQRGGEVEMQEQLLSTLPNVDQPTQKMITQNRSSGGDPVHRNDKENVDNFQLSILGVTSNQVSYETEQQQQKRLSMLDTEGVHGCVKEKVETPLHGESWNIIAHKSLPKPTKKVPHAEGLRKMPSSAAPLGGPTNQQSGKPQDQQMMQQLSVRSTEETHRKQKSMDRFDSEAACRALLGVSHSLQGVTTTARPSGRIEQQQPNILGVQSSVDGSASTIARAKPIDVTSEQEDGKSRNATANESVPESSKKAPDEEGRKMPSSAAPLGDLPPQQQTVQQLAVQSTVESHEPTSKDSCNAEAECSDLLGVSDSMQGVTTTSRLSGQIKQHNHQQTHQLNILESQLSVDGSASAMTRDKPFDFVSEQESVPVSEQQQLKLLQLDNFTFCFDESVKRMLESVNGLKRAREESGLMEEHMSLLLRLQLAAMPTMRDSITAPLHMPTNQNILMQISMVQSQLQACLQHVRISRAWIDFEYEKQMMSMQQLMASYSQMIMMMNEGAGGVAINEETVAEK